MAGTFLDRVSNKALGEMLVDKGTLTNEQVEQALTLARESEIRLGEALIKLGFVSRDAIGYAIGEQYGIRPMELTTSMLDPMLIRRFPVPFLRRHNMLPLIQLQDEIVVVLSDPSDQKGLQELSEFVPGWAISPQLADANQIRRCLDTLGGHSEKAAPQSDAHQNQTSAEPDSANDHTALIAAALNAWPGQLRIRQTPDTIHIFRQLPGNNLEPLLKLTDEKRTAFYAWARRDFHPMVFSHGKVSQYSETIDHNNEKFGLRLFQMPSDDAPDLLLQALKITGEGRPNLFQWLSEINVQPATVTAIQVPDSASLGECVHSFVQAQQQRHAIVFLNQQLSVQPQSIPTFSAPFTDVCAACAGTAPTLVLLDNAPSVDTIHCIHAAAAFQPAIVFFTGNQSDQLSVSPKSQDAVFALLSQPILRMPNHETTSSLAENGPAV